MGNLIFIIGGARSGKSRFAVKLAKKTGGHVLFIATCKPEDDEMITRIKMHKRRRPAAWKVIEEGGRIDSGLLKKKGRFDAIIIDCLGLHLSNLLSLGLNQKIIAREIKSIAKALSKIDAAAIVVSNDVGSGIVPDNPLAREFRDIMGISNQIIARYADTVYVMQAGIPIKIKEHPSP